MAIKILGPGPPEYRMDISLQLSNTCVNSWIHYFLRICVAHVRVKEVGSVQHTTKVNQQSLIHQSACVVVLVLSLLK